MDQTANPYDDIDTSQPRLAVLIDADNASPAVIEGLLAEIARFGVASVRRLYGDWTSPRHGGWKKVLLEHSLAPVQQFAYTTGKNATDSAMIIDAMDLMYTRRFAGFCLVSSDSDFTRLAQRLREEGLLVLGFGEKKTPAAFVAACDKFIYTELLVAAGRAAPARPAAKPAKTTAGKTPAASPPEPGAPAAAREPDAEPGTDSGNDGTAAGDDPQPPFELISRAINESDDDEGWAQLGAVGSYLNKVRPDFDARLYGHKKLSELLRAHPERWEMRVTGVPDTGIKLIHVRPAQEKPAPAKGSRRAGSKGGGKATGARKPTGDA